METYVLSNGLATRRALILKMVVLALLMGGLGQPRALRSQSAVAAGPPPSTSGVFPVSKLRPGLMGTAWTVFSGSKPEPMEVEILGILRGARGPGQDMILARLRGTKPEYTGVVEGMSGSPVYIDGKLLGALSFRIGQFSKEPIAGITPIGEMLAISDMPTEMLRAGAGDGTAEEKTSGAKARTSSGGVLQGINLRPTTPGTETNPWGPRLSDPPVDSALMTGTPAAAENNFRMMETPLVMAGFAPEAVALWQKKMAGTALADVAAGGMSGTSESSGEISPTAIAGVVPGSAVSAQLVRGDMEISATCTVTYVDPKKLLACGHPILQAGPVSLPMTTADVVATLPSPLNAFKIINTGATIGAFSQDRNAAITGVLGARARMIPMHVAIDSPNGKRAVNVEIVDLPSLTPQAMMVVLFNSLLQSNDSTADSSYHVTGSIEIDGHAASPIDTWAAPNDGMPPPLQAALFAGDEFTKLYANAGRQSTIRGIDLHVEAVPRRLQVQLEAARLVNGDMVHAGDTVMVEATLHPWQQATRMVRIPVRLPARLDTGNLRLLVSDAGTLDRALDPPRPPGRQPDLDSVLAQYQRLHSADRVYVSLLIPEAQAGIHGATLTSLPLSVANAMEPLRATQEAGLNGESAVVTGDAAAGGVLTGFQVINLHVEAGGGLN